MMPQIIQISLIFSQAIGNKCSVPLGKVVNTLIKIQFIFDKSLLPMFTFGERAIFRLHAWEPVCQQNGKYNNHLSELPYENQCSVPPGKC